MPTATVKNMSALSALNDWVAIGATSPTVSAATKLKPAKSVNPTTKTMPPGDAEDRAGLELVLIPAQRQADRGGEDEKEEPADGEHPLAISSAVS